VARSVEPAVTATHEPLPDGSHFSRVPVEMASMRKESVSPSTSASLAAAARSLKEISLNVSSVAPVMVATVASVGASLTGVTEVERVMALDHCPVVPSVALMSDEAEYATAASETRMERDPGVPLKSRTLGMKRSLAVVGSRMAALLEGAAPRLTLPSAMVLQVLPLSVEYCQMPCVVELELLPVMAMPLRGVVV